MSFLTIVGGSIICFNKGSQALWVHGSILCDPQS